MPGRLTIRGRHGANRRHAVADASLARATTFGLGMMVLAGAMTATAPAPAGAQTFTGTLTTIRSRGEIVIGHRESEAPFSYISEALEPSGYAIELCGHIATAVRDELGLPDLPVRYLPVTPQTALPLLVNGTIDLECGTTTNTYARQQQVDFTHTIFITGTRLLVRAASRVKEIEDVGGGSLTAVRGSTSEQEAAVVLRAGSTEALVTPVEDAAAGLESLRDRRVWAFAADDVVLFELINRSRNPDAWKVTGRYLSYEPYAIMLRRNDSAFRRVANRALSDLFRTGRIEEIYRRHFEPHRIPLPPIARAAFALQAIPEG